MQIFISIFDVCPHTKHKRSETNRAFAMAVLKGAYPTAVDNDTLQNLFNFRSLSLDYTLTESYTECHSDQVSSMTISSTMAYWVKKWFCDFNLRQQNEFHLTYLIRFLRENYIVLYFNASFNVWNKGKAE